MKKITTIALLLPFVLTACGEKLPDCGDQEVTDQVKQQMIGASKDFFLAAATQVFQSGDEWGQILETTALKSCALMGVSELQVIKLLKENKAPFKYSTEVKSIDVVLSNFRMEEEKKEPHVKLCAASFSIQGMAERVLDVSELANMAKGGKKDQAAASRLEQIEGGPGDPQPASNNDGQMLSGYWEDIASLIQGTNMGRRRELLIDQTKNTVTEKLQNGSSPVTPQKYAIQKTTDGKLLVELKN